MLTFEGLLLAAAIFVLRLLNYAISTVRVVAVARQQRMIAAVLGFLEALVFAVVISRIVNDLENFINLMAYCLGAAVGGWVGMILESRFITSYMTVNVIATQGGHDLAVYLRDQGYGVTETIGEGRDGSVTMLRSVVDSKDAGQVVALVRERDPKAFVSLEEARTVQQGYLRPRHYRRAQEKV